jgi:hypothetical protein
MNDWTKHALTSPGAALRERDSEIAELIDEEKLRLAGRARSHGLGSHEQVRRRIARQAVLRWV